MKPLNKDERAYAADRIGTLVDPAQERRQNNSLTIPKPIERYHEVWEIIEIVLKKAGVVI